MKIKKQFHCKITTNAPRYRFICEYTTGSLDFAKLGMGIIYKYVNKCVKMFSLKPLYTYRGNFLFLNHMTDENTAPTNAV